MAYTKYTVLANSGNYGATRLSSAIKYLVYHFTANKTDKASSNANYFKNNVVKASAHYFVDDTTVYQSVLDLKVAWAVSGNKWSDCAATGGGTMYGKVTNSNSISIEMCSTNGVISEATIANAITLGKEIMKKYNIPISNVYRHFDVNGKHCPGWNGWYGVDSSKWTNFKNRLSNITASSTNTIASASKFKIDSNIKTIQNWLNSNYKTGILEDGVYGKKTKTALVKAWQTEVGGLYIDGIFGDKCKNASSNHVIKQGSTGILVTIWQAFLVCNGYNPNGIDGNFATRSHSATVSYQRANGLYQDGIVGKNSWTKAFG